ncbi:MAG: hypothetical protein ACMUJM_24190 [bacterium]
MYSGKTTNKLFLLVAIIFLCLIFTLGNIKKSLAQFPFLPIFYAEQAGYWDGFWFSYLKLQAGPMNLNLVEDPVTGALSGTATLILNKLIQAPVSVSGINTGAGYFGLSGTFFDPINLITYTLELSCVLTSDTSMAGDYYIHDQLYSKTDFGEFSLNLGVSTIGFPTILPLGTSTSTLLTATLLTPTILPAVTPTVVTPTIVTPTAVAAPIVPTLAAPTIAVPTVVAPTVVAPPAITVTIAVPVTTAVPAVISSVFPLFLFF